VEPVLLRERHGGVLVATLNRPAKANAIDRSLMEELERLAEELEQRSPGASGVRALVLTGRGAKAFSAGADVSELDGITGATAFAQMRRGQTTFDRLERLPVPVIVALNGYALGGGLELAMAGDLRVASPRTRVGLPEITLENLPGWGGTQRLPQLVGHARAMELILTGKVIDASQAHDWGLVNIVCDDPLAVALELALELARRSAVAVSGVKEAVRAGLEHGTSKGSLVEATAVAKCCETDEQRQAVQSFLARRAPRTPPPSQTHP
jgi:enoyl-CoA hydratase